MAAPEAPAGVHELIEHLIRSPADRPLVKTGPEPLFDRFGVAQAVRSVLRSGGRDELSALGIHPNMVVKWLIWSGRPTMPFFAISHYFDRR
jgi:2'-aminobiphenyl-2,3-diol 1,2-dioxygenase, small subunit